jgi:myo-inositol 2-dehydrogenase / D-chiro-inositol 1-dehydrogenase
MSQNDTKHYTRRQFLRTAGKTGVILGFPTVVPANVLGKQAPSNRIQVGMIGMGRQAMYANLPPFLQSDDARVVAVCDVDRWRLDKAKEKVDSFYKNRDCQAYSDWREVVARDDIDAIMNSTSDQWHVPISLKAVQRGKHVSCEKPLTLSIAEGRVLANAARKHGVVFRTDSECRSHRYMHKVTELAINGYLGVITRIEVGVPGSDIAGGKSEPMPIPEELDYDMWLGPAPKKSYTLDRVHPRQAYTRPGWMRCRDTCEGIITNWGTHLLDVAQAVNQTEQTGPLTIEGTGSYPKSGSGLWNVLLDFKVQYQYANGVRLDYRTAPPFIRVEGEEGWIQAHWHSNGGIFAHDKKALRIKLKDTDRRCVLREDKEDFIYAIKHQCETMCNAEVGHRTCSVGQLGHIAIQRGRKLHWDPKQETFLNDEKANRMQHISYREPWTL